MQKKDQELKKYLVNPFLQQNPFHIHRSFFSSVKGYDKSINNQYSKSFANPAISIQDLASQAPSSINNKNPFSRTSLLNSNSDCYMLPYSSQDHKKEIAVPDFLSALKQKEVICPKAYQDLSYKYKALPNSYFPPSQNLEKNKQVENKQNKPELNINLGGLVSPRFGSHKNLCPSTRVNEGFNKIQSLKVFEEPKIQQVKKQTNRSYVNTKRTSSMKQIVDRQQPSKLNKQEKIQADLSPSEIKVRGSYFYKARLHNFYTHI